ncbi:MAG: endosialidase [Blautia sp.]|nr:endosialidase [Blautia sp.]
MAVIKELIRAEEDGTVSFGNYQIKEKAKVPEFPHQGDVYKVKTFCEITKLEKNGMFVYESVPGSTVCRMSQEESGMHFFVEGQEDAQITVELEADTEYEVFINDASTGTVTTNLGGKLSFSVELQPEQASEVRIVKCEHEE